MKEALFTKSLTLALSPEVFTEIKKITDDEKISMAEWVRDAVETALENMKSMTKGSEKWKP